MPAQMVSIRTDDGECAAGLHTPSGAGPWPGVLMFPDGLGLRDTFLAMGERLAGLGYVTLVPNIYYRSGDFPQFDIKAVGRDPTEQARLSQLITTLDREAVTRDAGAYLGYLLGRDEVTGTAVGTTGYCLGGFMSLSTAGLYPDQVAAAASFHGGNLAAADNPNSPHRLVSAMQAEVYVAAAANDPWFPPDQYERLEEALNSAGARYRMETYPAGHGFAVPDNPTYDAAAEQRHWDALADLYSRLPR